MANLELTAGTINTLMGGGEAPEGPMIQILGMRKIQSGGQDRYRLHISDGEYSHSFAMLGTQLNNMVLEDNITNNCIVKVNKMVCNHMNNKDIIILLDLDVMADGVQVGGKVGNPTPWAPGAPAGRPTPAPSAAAAPARTPAAKPAATDGGIGSSFSGGGNGRQTCNNNPPPSRSSTAASLSSQDLANSVIPIRDINPYNNKLTIRARVIKKGDVKTWSNAKGDGKLFSMELLDDSGEIRMTGFNQSVDSFYEMIEVNNVYYFSRFTVKSANKAFTSIPHDYELTFHNDTQVIPCMEDASDIPQLTFNFVNIADIENVEAEKTVDVIGVCKQFAECTSIITRNTGKELKKREITLVDKTCREINLTLWGKTAEDFSDDSQPIIAVKGAKVSDYSGRSLSLLQSSTMQINPDLPEAHALRGWFDDEGSNLTTQSFSRDRGGSGGAAPFKLLTEVNEVISDDMEKSDFFMSKVTLMAIKRENAMYKACIAEKCNKKVVDLGNGMYRCEKCQKDVTSCKSVPMLQCNFADFSDNVWATCFREQAEAILGQKSDALGEMFDNQPDEFDGIIREAVFNQFIIKFRSRMESFNGETRKKFSVVDLNKINHAEYCKTLLADIQESAA